jgi:hypothetical protein
VRVSTVNVILCSVVVACTEGLSRQPQPSSSLAWRLYPHLAKVARAAGHIQLEQEHSFASLRLLGLPLPYPLEVPLGEHTYMAHSPLGCSME